MSAYAPIETDPRRFFVPPYVGHHGWVGVHLDVAVNWEELAGLVEDGHRMTAPKRLLAIVGPEFKKASDASHGWVLTDPQ